MGTCSRESRLCRDSSSSHPSTVRTMAEAKFLILVTLAFCLLHLAHNSPTGLDGFQNQNQIGSFGEFLHGIGVHTHLCDEQCVFSRLDRNSDGFLSMPELGVGWYHEPWNTMDENRDGLIGVQEYII